MNMEGRGLRRSYTQVEFPIGRNKMDLSGKQQVRTSKKFNNMPTNRSKFPTLEIYRPPGQRIMQEVREGGPGLGGDDGGGAASKLNVHAKEFVMNNNNNQSPLQTSKSTGNILSHHHHSQHQGDPRRGQTGGRVNFINHQRQAAGLERTASVQTVVSHSPSQVHHQQQHSVKVSQAVETQETVKPKVQKETDSIMKSIMKDVALRREGTELRRSKSLYVPHTGGARASVATNIGNSLLNNNSLSNSIGLNLSAALFDHQLPQEIAQLITRTQTDLSGYTLAEFAQLARSLVQKADEERKHAERLADACITVIQREPHSTFIEALINYLIYSVEKKMEEPGKSSSHALMAFLSHLYSQVKATGRFMDSKLRSTSNPSSQILHLLAQCCICTLRNPTLTQRNEIECLFFVITTVGRELEQESVNLLGELIDAVRDAFYFAKVSDSRIRKTLLQIMELHASNWQMSAETLSFYQSTANDHLFLK